VVARGNPIVHESLSIVFDCATIFRESAKRELALREIANDLVALVGSFAKTWLAICGYWSSGNFKGAPHMDSNNVGTGGVER
jgi:hypothetical protein